MINVIFNLTNCAGKEVYSKIFVSPVEGPWDYSSSVITNDAVVYFDKISPFTASLVPGVYKATMTGKNTDTFFYFNLSSSLDNTTVYVADHLTTASNLPVGNDNY